MSYTYDHFGKRQVLDASGSAIAATQYANPYGYTSRRHDSESGLIYFRARYYDPTTGEFASRDPLEYVDGMSMMRGYMAIGSVDPKGLDCSRSGKPELTNVYILVKGIVDVSLSPRVNFHPTPMSIEPSKWYMCQCTYEYSFPFICFRTKYRWSGLCRVFDGEVPYSKILKKDTRTRTAYKWKGENFGLSGTASVSLPLTPIKLTPSFDIGVTELIKEDKEFLWPICEKKCLDSRPASPPGWPKTPRR